VVTGVLKTDSSAVSEVMWPEITEAIGSRWHDSLMARRTVFTPAAIDSVYSATDSNAVRVMQHVLIRVAPNATVAERSTAQRKAAGILAKARAGSDFAQLARQFTDDRASQQTGGVMNAAPRGAYVTPFDSAGWSLRPGEISGVVASPFGFHVIRRPPLAEVRTQITQYVEYSAGRRLDSLYMDSLGTAKHLEVKASAPSLLRTALDDPEGNRRSSKALATYDGGKLTMREMLRWTGSMPPQMVSQLKSATDSQMVGFVRALSQNLLLIDDAKSNGITLSPDEFAQLRVTYLAGLDTLRYTLGVTADVTDTTASLANREQATMLQISNYVGRLLRREAPARAIPGPMTWYLRDRIPYRINMAGISRAAEVALARRDSTQAASPQTPALPGPPSAVPQINQGAAPAAPQGGRH
jgi:hypothetical protein